MRESLSLKKGQREKFRRRNEGRSLQTSSVEGKLTGFNEYCVNFAPKTEIICANSELKRRSAKELNKGVEDKK